MEEEGTTENKMKEMLKRYGTIISKNLTQRKTFSHYKKNIYHDVFFAEDATTITKQRIAIMF